MQQANPQLSYADWLVIVHFNTKSSMMHFGYLLLD